MKQPTKDELYAAADEAYNLGWEDGYRKGWVDAGRTNPAAADPAPEPTLWDKILGRTR